MSLDQKTLSANILRQVTLDSPQERRSLWIKQGNMLEDYSDLWVVTIHGEKDAGHEGDLIEAVKREFGIERLQERPLMTAGRNGWISRLSDEVLQEDLPFMLALHTGMKEGEKVEIEQYHQWIEAIFSSIAVLEYEGRVFRTIVLPVMVRKGLADHDYPQAASVLIRYAAAWLRKSVHTQSISYYLYHEEEGKEWLNAIDSVLGQASVNTDKQPILVKLRDDILKEMDQVTLDPSTKNRLFGALQDKLKTIGHMTWANMRKPMGDLTQEIIRDLTNRTGYRNLRELKDNRVFVEWLIVYLYSMNIGQSYQSNLTASRKPLGPSEWQQDDRLVYLAVLLRTLKFWNEMRSQYPGKGERP